MTITAGRVHAASEDPPQTPPHRNAGEYRDWQVGAASAGIYTGKACSLSQLKTLTFEEQHGEFLTQLRLAQPSCLQHIVLGERRASCPSPPNG
jgi:hypothetical protein